VGSLRDKGGTIFAPRITPGPSLPPFHKKKELRIGRIRDSMANERDASWDFEWKRLMKRGFRYLGFEAIDGQTFDSNL